MNVKSRGCYIHKRNLMEGRDRYDLQSILEDISFTCGAQLQDSVKGYVTFIQEKCVAKNQICV